jgi:hypothetical protein
VPEAKMTNVISLFNFRVTRRTYFTDREREIICICEQYKGRPLTQEEINNSLEQARAIHGDDLMG